MEKTIADKTIDVNEEGYLTDSSQWDEAIAHAIAKEEGIDELGEGHWTVINYLREKYAEEVEMTIRKLKNSGIVTVKELYALFPKGPLKKAAKIAGIPKPKSCI